MGGEVNRAFVDELGLHPYKSGRMLSDFIERDIFRNIFDHNGYLGARHPVTSTWHTPSVALPRQKLNLELLKSKTLVIEEVKMVLKSLPTLNSTVFTPSSRAKPDDSTPKRRNSDETSKGGKNERKDPPIRDNRYDVVQDELNRDRYTPTPENLRGGLRLLANHPESIIFFTSKIINVNDFIRNYLRYKISPNRIKIAPPGADVWKYAEDYRKKNPISPLKK